MPLTFAKSEALGTFGAVPCLHGFVELGYIWTCCVKSIPTDISSTVIMKSSPKSDCDTLVDVPESAPTIQQPRYSA